LKQRRWRGALNWASDLDSDRQRIDRWLWHARIVRTRESAAALAGAGFVRVNGARIAAPGRAVRLGDVVTVALDRTVRVLRVKGFAERRGPAGTAVALYEDLAERPAAARAVPGQDPGDASGRDAGPQAKPQTLRADDPCDRSSAPKSSA
jgi:ribosome-associated heat shock protein Hsp15